MKSDPLIVCGRGHSGTRLLAKILISNGYDFGKLDKTVLDSVEWSNLIVPYYNWRHNVQGHGHCDIDCFVSKADILSEQQAELWGWKLGESIFLYEDLCDIFQYAKFINIIRDGRDVIMSPIWPGFYTYQRHMHEYGHARSDAEMFILSWMKHVDKALSITNDNFLNILYEDLCLHPDRTIGIVSSFLGRQIKHLNLPETNRIGKWKSETRPEYIAAFKMAEPLLKRLYGNTI